MADKIATLEFEKPVVELESKILELTRLSDTENIDFGEEINILKQKCEKLKKEIYGSLTTWQRVQLARHPSRPYSFDYINLIFEDFLELHGDRNFMDDEALLCGIGYLQGRKVFIVGHQKGRDIQESMRRNFGMPHPEGYRKAARIFRLAEKYAYPVVCFIDTPGAYPGVGAEERGQATAIAENLRQMALLGVPVISIVIGEGGSGGALAIGVTDRIFMLENSYYSVISPEGCAAILFRDSSKAADAAKALKITANDLKELGVIDEIIKEPVGGAHRDYAQTAENIKNALLSELSKLCSVEPAELVRLRLKKFRDIGCYLKSKNKTRASRKIKKKKA